MSMSAGQERTDVGLAGPGAPAHRSFPWGWAAMAAILPLALAISTGFSHLGSTPPAPIHSHVHVPAAVLAPATIAASAPVSRAGWTAAGGAAVARAFDGDPTTYWSSRPLPASLTIDMHGDVAVGGLTYLPPPGATGQANIGRFRVELSADGVSWGAPVATGTFADDDTLKSVQFTPRTTRFVRLAALTEADGGSAPIGVSELNVLAALDPALPRTGWTATASSYQDSSNAPGNVLDGNTSTIWHSQWTSPIDTLPNDITLDMKTSYTVTGLSYLPRQGTTRNGTIGQYRVDVSTNASTWTTVASGTWADTSAAKTVTFTGRTARYVRLTGITEAGNRGPWTSAAEINVLGTGTGPVLGRWSAPISFPLVPASAALLPNGKVLTWSANATDNFGGTGQTITAIYDPATGSVSQRTVSNTGHNMFCPGISTLPDGRILVNGGDDASRSSIYNYSTDTWTAGPAMAIPRAYQSSVTLSDGRVFAIGGSWDGGQGGKNGEIWSSSAGWQRLSNALVAPMLTADAQGVYRADNHAWLFAWSGGRVLQAGPSKAMNWYGTTGSGSTTAAGTRASDPDSMTGTAVMYDTGRILTLGGAPNYQDSNATANAHLITISGTSSVSVRTLSSMRYARAYHNSVVLPDGKVLVVGGESYAVPFSDNTSVYNAELWDPATETFTTLAAAAVPRNYHSVAVLLPDGRVFTGGGGLCGSCGTNHFNAEIFTPPYLLNSDGTTRSRPAITSAPGTTTYGASITLSTDRTVSAFSIIRLGTATHTVDTDQRRISLTPTVVTGGYRLTIPTDPGIVVPGYYMLFALDANGVPSVSRTIRIG